MASNLSSPYGSQKKQRSCRSPRLFVFVATVAFCIVIIERKTWFLSQLGQTETTVQIACNVCRLAVYQKNHAAVMIFSRLCHSTLLVFATISDMHSGQRRRHKIRFRRNSVKSEIQNEVLFRKALAWRQNARVTTMIPLIEAVFNGFAKKRKCQRIQRHRTIGVRKNTNRSFRLRDSPVGTPTPS